MVEHIYYKDQNGYVGCYEVEDPAGSCSISKAEALKRIAERNEKIISEQEYDSAALQAVSKRLKNCFEANDLGTIFRLVKSNVFAFRAFEELTGIHLEKKWEIRRQQLIEYFGDKYNAWQEEEQRKAEEEERQKIEKAEQQRIAEEERRNKQAKIAEQKYKEGSWISGQDFLLLCDVNNIDMHPRTLGFCRQKLYDVNTDGRVHIPNKARYPQGVSDAIQRLNQLLALA